jgi:hypothetical protein
MDRREFLRAAGVTQVAWTSVRAWSGQPFPIDHAL